MTIDEVIKERDMYKKMYYKLGAKVSDAIEVCKDPIVKNMLINAHRETEEMYISKGLNFSEQ